MNVSATNQLGSSIYDSNAPQTTLSVPQVIAPAATVPGASAQSWQAGSVVRVNGSTNAQQHPAAAATARRIVTLVAFFLDGGVYLGTIDAHHRRHGRGLYTWRNGERYGGEYREGLRHGQGIMNFLKARYEGSWLNDQMEGWGIYWNEGNRYEGNFKNGKQSGYGTMHFSNGDMYRGSWEADNMTGRGMYIWAGGMRYEGGMSNGRRTGIGRLIQTNGETYFGTWMNNKKNGHGTYIWPNVKTYKGHYKNDRRTGFGVMVYVSGEKYAGAWLNDMMHGQGIHTLPTGERFEGVFRNGIWMGPSSATP